MAMVKVMVMGYDDDDDDGDDDVDGDALVFLRSHNIHVAHASVRLSHT